MDEIERRAREVNRIVSVATDAQFTTLTGFTDALFACENTEHLDDMIGAAVTLLHSIAALTPAPAVWDRETLAATVHIGRFLHPEKATPFATEDRRGKDYCYRIADLILRKSRSTPAPVAGDVK